MSAPPDPVATRDREERRPSRFVRPQAMRNLTSEKRMEERASTWLELFFDLCFVVGVLLAIEAAAPQYALAAGGLAAGYSLGARTVLAGGLILFLLGIAFVDRINEGTANDRVLLARLGAVALLILVTPLGSLLSPLAFTATVALVLLALAIFETLSEDSPGETSAP